MEDYERRPEKYRPWERYTKDGEVDSKKSVDYISLRKVHNSESTSDSGAWIPTPSELEYKSKIFNDPRNVSSDKENAPLVDSCTMPTHNILNMTEDELCEIQKFVQC